MFGSGFRFYSAWDKDLQNNRGDTPAMEHAIPTAKMPKDAAWANWSTGVGGNRPPIGPNRYPVDMARPIPVSMRMTPTMTRM